GSYVIHSQAIDKAGNAQTIYGAATITYANTPVTSAITAPTDGTTYNATQWDAVSPLAGTSSTSTAATVTEVDVSIQNKTSGLYWNPVAGNFSANSLTFIPTTPGNNGTTWTYAFPSSNFGTAYGTYIIQSLAKDSLGRAQVTLAIATINFDNSGSNLSSAITSPIDTKSYNTAGWPATAIQGTYTGSATGVNVSILGPNNLYWDSATSKFDLSNESSAFNAVTPSAGTWSYAF